MVSAGLEGPLPVTPERHRRAESVLRRGRDEIDGARGRPCREPHRRPRGPRPRREGRQVRAREEEEPPQPGLTAVAPRGASSPAAQGAAAPWQPRLCPPCWILQGLEPFLRGQRNGGCRFPPEPPEARLRVYAEGKL